MLFLLLNADNLFNQALDEFIEKKLSEFGVSVDTTD